MHFRIISPNLNICVQALKCNIMQFMNARSKCISVSSLQAVKDTKNGGKYELHESERASCVRLRIKKNNK